MTKDLEELRRIVRSFPLTEGRNKTDIPFLSIYRSTKRKFDMPKADNFYIYVVLEGSVRLYTPSGIMDYLEGQYSVSKIDTSNSGYILTFSEQGDFLALSIELTLNDVISVLLDIEGGFGEKIAAAELDDTSMSASDRNVISSVCRLCSMIGQPMERAFMEKHLKREIIFYILCGSCGSQFLQSGFILPGTFHSHCIRCISIGCRILHMKLHNGAHTGFPLAADTPNHHTA